MESRKRASAPGFTERPYSEQSLIVPFGLVSSRALLQEQTTKAQKLYCKSQERRPVQNVGTMMILAPAMISSRKASGKARSQHIRRPTGPMGV